MEPLKNVCNYVFLQKFAEEHDYNKALFAVIGFFTVSQLQDKVRQDIHIIPRSVVMLIDHFERQEVGMSVPQCWVE